MNRCALLLLLAMPGASVAAAQRATLAGSLTRTRVRSTIGPTEEVLSGSVLGVEGRFALWRIVVNVGYAQGSLKPDSGSAAARDVVEGRLLLGVRPIQGMSLKVGPHIRSYVSNSGTQRWFFWEARLRGERAIIGGVSGYAEVWRVLSGDVNVLEPFNAGQGGEAGMLYTVPGRPFWGRLGYGIEHARLGSGSRLETVEGVSLTVGYGWR